MCFRLFHRKSGFVCIGVAAAALFAIAGPAVTAFAASPRSYGIVYYLDGAGGGGLLLNWGRRVKDGLETGGFRGDFEDHDWHTGLGPLVDHAMGESFKREAGEKLAREIAEHMDRHPGEPVHLIGLSAGTAVLVYALEALPAGKQVDTVVVLNSSMSAGHDLTEALRHVRGKLYAFGSQHDPVLNAVIPMVGTADREFRLTDVAGLRGFHMPSEAGPETQSLYSKVVNVPWRSEFARYGNFGTHTGTTTPDFVARVITPLLKADSNQSPSLRRARTSSPRPFSGRTER